MAGRKTGGNHFAGLEDPPPLGSYGEAGKIGRGRGTVPPDRIAVRFTCLRRIHEQSCNMLRTILGGVAALAFVFPVGAQVKHFPKDFRTQDIKTAEGVTIHVRTGGHGPAVVLIHGFGDTGDMWAPLAAELARDHTVVVPDLRGMGLSSHPPEGYDKRTQAADVWAVLAALNIDQAAIVGHDIGNMVTYAYAARYPDKTEKLVVMDAPVPGIPPWDDLVRNPLLWHFSFGGPDAERLVAGRERIYLDRFWNEFAADRSKIDEAGGVSFVPVVGRRGRVECYVPVLEVCRSDFQNAGFG